MGGYHKPYRSRPPANRSAARFAWDWFVGDEVAGRNREPKSMGYTHMDYWVWVMEFTNGEFEEKDALECQHWHEADQPAGAEAEGWQSGGEAASPTLTALPAQASPSPHYTHQLQPACSTDIRCKAG